MLTTERTEDTERNGEWRNAPLPWQCRPCGTCPPDPLGVLARWPIKVCTPVPAFKCDQETARPGRAAANAGAAGSPSPQGFDFRLQRGDHRFELLDARREARLVRDMGCSRRRGDRLDMATEQVRVA